MKTKLTLALVLSLVLVLFVVGSASAIKLVSYDDTAGENLIPESESGEGSLICNGNFDDWTGGVPDCWTVVELAQSGWEEDHLSNVNLAFIGDTAVEIPFNDGLGLFVRNIGGTGPHFIYAYNELTNVTASGYYWVETHATMWGYFQQEMYAGTITNWGDVPYNTLLTEDGVTLNSQAFYGIGHLQEGAEAADPSDVSEWRELFPVAFNSYQDPDSYLYDNGSTYGQGWEAQYQGGNRWIPGVVPCANAWEACYNVARYETIWIDADSTPYYWLKAGQKFDTFNVWTVFVFDDILIQAADDSDDGSMHDINGATGWDQEAAR